VQEQFIALLGTELMRMKYKSVSSRLKASLAGFKASFCLSLTGVVLEVLALLFMYNIILLTDLAHWLIDTTLELLFLASISYASRSYRRFPLGTLVLESVLITTVAFAMLGVYGYFFASYFASYNAQELSGSYHPLLALVTALGGALTATAAIVQRRRYSELRLEAIKVDYVHVTIDTLAAVVATTGVLVVSCTSNPSHEAFFTAMLTFFVVHGVVEVLRDTFKTISGRNVEPELKLRVFEELVRSLRAIYVKSVDARKIGSFYVVSIHVAVSPKTTVEEAYRLRNQIISLVRELNELVYHVDVYISPFKRPKRKRR
jgi:divalent metal cation (Fe/Co/Zn/Cd) transporter